MFEFAFLTAAFLLSLNSFFLAKHALVILPTDITLVSRCECLWVCVCVAFLRKRMFPCTYNSEKIACTDSMISSRIEGSPTFLLLILDLHFQGQFSLFNNLRNIVNGEKYSKHYYCHSRRSRVFAIEWLHFEFLYIMTLAYIFKITNFEM